MATDKKPQTACFCGPAALPGGLLDKSIERNTERVVASLIEKGYRYFGAGGTRGFDGLAARVVLKLKEKHPGVHLILVLPFAEQYRHEGNWSDAELEAHTRLVQQASKVVVLAERYSSGAYNRCRRHLVDGSSAFIVCLERDNSEESYTTAYARSRHLAILNVVDSIVNITNGI